MPRILHCSLQLVRLFSSVVVARTTRHPVTSETASFTFPFLYDMALTFSDVYVILYLARKRMLFPRNTHRLQHYVAV